MSEPSPEYLQPYQEAIRRRGAKFESLLWSSPETQRLRFEAIAHLGDFAGRAVLDAGAGRADFRRYLQMRNIEPAHYVALEAMDEFADVAQQRKFPNTFVSRGDFVADPVKLFVGAETVIFCGSLNTMDDATFYRVLKFAWDATAEQVVFNFLCSNRLAHSPHLYWRSIDQVRAFVTSLTPEVQFLDDYLDGDCACMFEKSMLD